MTKSSILTMQLKRRLNACSYFYSQCEVKILLTRTLIVHTSPLTTAVYARFIVNNPDLPPLNGNQMAWNWLNIASLVVGMYFMYRTTFCDPGFIPVGLVIPDTSHASPTAAGTLQVSAHLRPTSICVRRGMNMNALVLVAAVRHHV